MPRKNPEISLIRGVHVAYFLENVAENFAVVTSIAVLDWKDLMGM
jgi:hypothetical protein